MKSDPPTDPTAFSFFNEIGIIDQLARSRFEGVMPDRLTIAQFSVLNHFVRLGGEPSPATLARAFQVTKGTMTSTLHKLEARGFVEISPDPSDGRAKLVRITPAGRRAREACVRALEPALADLAEAIPEKRFKDALPFLRRLREHLDRSRN